MDPVHIHIEGLPTKFIHYPKRKGEPKTFYATGNVFFSGELHFSQRKFMQVEAMTFLTGKLSRLPRFESVAIDLIIHHRPERGDVYGWDLDNKASFWLKMLLDVLKPRQRPFRKKGKEYPDRLPRLGAIPDDSIRHIPRITITAAVGPPALQITFTPCAPMDKQTALEFEEKPF